jgi:acyl-CoA thioester hydrolase
MNCPQLEIRIYYEDTDCGGVVYYGNYLRYFERARTEFLRHYGIEVADYASKETLFVVSEAQIKYLSSAHYNDILVIETELTKVTGVRLHFNHEVKEKSSKRLVVTGFTELACVNLTGKPKRLSAEIINKLKSY